MTAEAPGGSQSPRAPLPCLGRHTPLRTLPTEYLLKAVDDSPSDDPRLRELANRLEAADDLLERQARHIARLERDIEHYKRAVGDTA
jgi:hypothetical protein